MESYNSVINRIDRTNKKKEIKKECSSRRTYSYKPKLYIRQADVLLVNFGNDDRCIHDKHPAVVISSDASLYIDNVLMVIPLFRKPSRDNSGSDVRIREIDCNGLRYEEYASVANIRKVYRRQVIKKIGHIKSEIIIKEIIALFLDKVGEI